MTDGGAHDEAAATAAHGDLYDEILRKEFGDGGVPRRPPVPADERPAIAAEVDGDEVGAEEQPDEEQPGEKEPEPIGAARRRRVRYGGAAVIALGGAACAVVGGLLGGLGAGTTVTPAAVHSMVDGKPAPGADLPNGLPALAPTPLGRFSLVGDRLPLTIVPTRRPTVGAAPLGSGAAAPSLTEAGPTTTTTPGPSTTTTAPPSTTTTAPPSSPGTPGVPAPVSGSGGIVATVGGTVQHVVTQLTSGLPGLPTSGASTSAAPASGTTGTCSGGSVESGATSAIGSLPVAGSVTGGTSSGSCTG
ncbi:MAG: hypothetical protein ACYCVC_07505 [Acidimicrobiales bacterium]